MDPRIDCIMAEIQDEGCGYRGLSEKSQAILSAHWMRSDGAFGWEHINETCDKNELPDALADVLESYAKGIGPEFHAKVGRMAMMLISGALQYASNQRSCDGPALPSYKDVLLNEMCEQWERGRLEEGRIMAAEHAYELKRDAEIERLAALGDDLRDQRKGAA